LKRFIFHLEGDYLSAYILTGYTVNSGIIHHFGGGGVTDSGYRNTALCQQILDVSVAEIESVVEPNSILNDFMGKSMPFV
jgi:hypothetical protein